MVAVCCVSLAAVVTVPTRNSPGIPGTRQGLSWSFGVHDTGKRSVLCSHVTGEVEQSGREISSEPCSRSSDRDRKPRSADSACFVLLPYLVARWGPGSGDVEVPGSAPGPLLQGAAGSSAHHGVTMPPGQRAEGELCPT